MNGFSDTARLLVMQEDISHSTVQIPCGEADGSLADEAITSLLRN
jgi:hypothetical protein